MALTPCPSCHRHLRADETACPFCGAPSSPSLPQRRPAPRMGRAALVLGATLVTTACGGSSEPTGSDTSGGESASADPTAPTQPTTPPAQPGPPEDDGGGVVALYGAPSD